MIEMEAHLETAYGRMHPANRETLETIRAMVFKVVETNPDIGTITETLKWGEPSYLTEQTKSGSTLRLSETRSDARPALFVNCKTTLADDIRELYPDTFEYRDNRALVLKSKPTGTEDDIKHAIALILTYHTRKKHR